MTPAEICEAARRGEVPKIVLVAGSEAHFRTQVLKAVKEATVGGGIPGLNEDSFTAGECDVDQVLSAAKTLPMLSQRRFVLVRSVERWEGQSDKAKDSDKNRTDPFERLLDYAKAPVSSTVLMLVAEKLDGRRKFATVAKKSGWFVPCDPLTRAAIPGWVASYAKSRSVRIDAGVPELIAEVAGTDLSALADAVDRLSLYVGENGVITEDSVGICLARVRTSTVWELVGAVGRRDLGAALTALDTVFDPSDQGLPLVGVLAWSARQLLKFESATRNGCPPAEAAQKAGAPPFRARELAEQIRLIPRGELERWLELLARVNLDLKGRSRRPARAVLEHAVMTLCRVQKPKAAGAARGRA